MTFLSQTIFLFLLPRAFLFFFPLLFFSNVRHKLSRQNEFPLSRHNPFLRFFSDLKEKATSHPYCLIEIKMQIQVKCSCGEEKCPEWAILELQGVVEVQPSFKDRLQNLQIGILCRPTSQVCFMRCLNIFSIFWLLFFE